MHAVKRIGYVCVYTSARDAGIVPVRRTEVGGNGCKLAVIETRGIFRAGELVQNSRSGSPAIVGVPHWCSSWRERESVCVREREGEREREME